MVQLLLVVLLVKILRQEHCREKYLIKVKFLVHLMLAVLLVKTKMLLF